MLQAGGVKAMDEQYAYMVEELELPEEILDELLGEWFPCPPFPVLPSV